MAADQVEYVHLIRHALPVGVSRVSRPDPELSGYGQRQARAVAAWWGGRPVTGVATSDMQRARQTADPVLADLRAGPIIEPGLAEIDLGADFYLPITDVLQAGGHLELAWWRNRIKDPDMVERREAFQTSAVRAFERVTDVKGEDPFLIFTHGGVISSVTRWILGAPSGLDADYASVTTLRRRPDGGWLIVSFSETQHLDHLGQPRQADGISLER